MAVSTAGVGGAAVCLAVLLGACASSSSSSSSSARPAAPAPAAGSVAATSGAAPQDWEVPPAEAARPNPLQSTPEHLRAGQELFNRHCTACHGVGGRGDGPMAQHWGRLPKDLTHPERQKRLTDGEIFWKISVGHRQGSEEIMPGLGGRLGADERWQLVLYVRSLAAR